MTATRSRFAAFRRSRRALGEFAMMQDYILRDIGLSRADVVQASIAGLGEDRIAILENARLRRAF